MSTKKRGKKDSGVESAASAALPDVMQQCAAILKSLLAMPEAEPFAVPVDWQAMQLYDYPEIIKKPMDLETIQNKLNEGKYPTPEKFCADVRLVWKNAMTYNRPDSEIHKTAEDMSKAFEKKYARIKRATAQTKRMRNDAPQITRQDRIRFSELVNQLTSEQLGQLVDMISRDCSQALTEMGDEIEIEINNIDPASLLALNAFCEECVLSNQKRKA